MAVLMIFSCVDDLDQFTPQQISLKGDITNLLYRLETPAQKFTINGEKGDTIVLENSVWLIPPFSFMDENGGVSIGEIQLELKELVDKSDLVRNNAPTITESDLLISDGAFLIEASAGGEDLSLTEGKSIRVFLKNENPQEKMELFYGYQPDKVSFFWEDADQNPSDWSNVWASEWSFENEGNLISGQGYEFAITKLGWVNCDLFDESLNTTQVCVSLPEGFNRENTKVFLSFNDLTSVTILESDIDSDFFCNIYSPIPLEYEVKILVMSELSGKYFAQQKNAVISQNLQLEMNPSLKSLDEIIDMIEGL